MRILTMMTTRSLVPVIAIWLAAPAAVQGQAYTAHAEVSGCGETEVSGRAQLIEQGSPEGIKVVEVHMVVRGLPDGKHAVHIHETAQCSPCSAAKGHFDPGPASDSSPDGNHPFHSGDLVNIEVRDGIGSMHTTTNRITLSPGPLSLFDEDGSAFIIHVDSDTYCPEGEVKGCAGGARAACGVITEM